MQGRGGGATKLERKIVERNRRMQMKNLCFKLSSLIQQDNKISKRTLAQHDQLDQATSYIKNLQERIERLKQRKEMVMIAIAYNKDIRDQVMAGHRLPVILVEHLDSNLEVAIVSGSNKMFMLHEVIGVLMEEGAEVVNANFSIVGDNIYLTIHSQAICARIGLEASRISKRLKELVH